MKNKFRFSSTVIISIFLLMLNTVPAYSFQTSFLDNITLSHKNYQSYATPITHEQTKEQVKFFREALDELGATSPRQVAKIWAKAEQTRNGVYHYAVACDELKAKIIKEWGEPKENYWIIGTSSPWLARYEIVSTKKLNNSSYEIIIKYFWTTSAGPYGSSQNTLLIVSRGDNWCVKQVK